jgi:Mn2+/Fe2+ NRAMP family transporter
MGYVFSEFDGQNKLVTKLAGSKVIEHLGGSNDVRLLLLLVPAVIILLFMTRTTKGGTLSINLLPAVAVGLLAVITVVPLLPLNTAVNVMGGSLWRDVTKYEGTLVALSTLVVGILLIAEHSKFGSLKPHKSSKHQKSKDKD